MQFTPYRDFPKMTQTRAVIQFQDCDPLGHLNNSKYLDYLFNAREAEFEHTYGFRMYNYFVEKQCSWVSYLNQIVYLRPAMPREKVQIFTSLIDYTEDSIVEEYFMTDENVSSLKCLFWSTSIFIDAVKAKRVAHPTELMNLLKQIKDDSFDYSHTSLIERIPEIKKNYLKKGTT